MIFELRTYSFKLGAVGEFYKRFAECYLGNRDKHSQISGSFYSEIGPLNQVLTIWPYESEAERERIRGETFGVGGWPPKTADLADTMVSEIYTPMSFTPKIPAGKFGPVYEVRSYLLKPGSKGEVEKSWGPTVEERRQMSPLIAAMYSDSGTLNKLVHIWAYESLDQRAAIRAEAAKKKIWPPQPMPPGTIISQENKIMLPAEFSPLQ